RHLGRLAGSDGQRGLRRRHNSCSAAHREATCGTVGQGARRPPGSVRDFEGRRSEDRGSIEGEAGSDKTVGRGRPSRLPGDRGVWRPGVEVRQVQRGDETVSDTRELYDIAMDLFEQGLLAARAGNSDESRRLFNQALENEASFSKYLEMAQRPAISTDPLSTVY